MELPSQVVVVELEFLEPGLDARCEMLAIYLAGPTLVGNEGPSTFTAWYIGDETSRNSLRVGPASIR